MLSWESNACIGARICGSHSLPEMNIFLHTPAQDFSTVTLKSVLKFTVIIIKNSNPSYDIIYSLRTCRTQI